MGLNYRVIGLFALVVFVAACANIRGIDGGAKDETPATILSISPANKTTRFKGNEIVLEFDEYVTMNNLTQELIVSPPLKTLPTASVKRKQVTITFKDLLEENTTYTFNFGNAIADVNEGNVTELVYVISTGEKIDSLSISGAVFNAETNEPLKGVKVCLYADTARDVVFKKNPLFFSKSLETGQFEVPYLKEGQFKLVAFDDANGNYRLDESEVVGFVEMPVQSTLPDSTQELYVMHCSPFRWDYPQSIDYKTDSLGGVKFKWDRRFGLPGFRSLNPEMAFTAPIPMEGDSLYYLPSNYTNANEMTVEISWFDTGLDSLGNQRGKTVLDTLGVQAGEDYINKPLKAIVLPSTKLAFNEPMKFKLDRPGILKGAKQILLMEDSLLVPVTVKADSINPFQWKLFAAWKKGAKYDLTFLPGAFEYNNQLTSDTVRSVINVYNAEDYGELKLTITGISPENTAVLQIRQGEKVIYEKVNVKDGELAIEQLLPGEYAAHLFYDTNENGRFDALDYLNFTPSEEMFICPSRMNVRANWQVAIKWDL